MSVSIPWRLHHHQPSLITTTTFRHLTAFWNSTEVREACEKSRAALHGYHQLSHLIQMSNVQNLFLPQQLEAVWIRGQNKFLASWRGSRTRMGNQRQNVWFRFSGHIFLECKWAVDAQNLYFSIQCEKWPHLHVATHFWKWVKREKRAFSCVTEEKNRFLRANTIFLSLLLQRSSLHH